MAPEAAGSVRSNSLQRLDRPPHQHHSQCDAAADRGSDRELRGSLVHVYRDSLRDTTQRGGKCRLCEYQKICGGSRYRAYALTRDYLAEDPRGFISLHLADAVVC